MVLFMTLLLHPLIEFVKVESRVYPCGGHKDKKIRTVTVKLFIPQLLVSSCIDESPYDHYGSKNSNHEGD